MTFADVTTGLTDVCDASPTTEVSKNNSTWLSSVSYDCTDAGTSPTLYVRATDASGNENQTSVSISIADNTAPVITGVSPTSVQLSTSAATVAISGLTITASDDCTSSGALTYTVSTAFAGTYGTSVDLDCWTSGTDDCCISLRRMPLGTRALSLVRTSQLPMRPASQPPARTSRWTWMPVVLTR